MADAGTSTDGPARADRPIPLRSPARIDGVVAVVVGAPLLAVGAGLLPHVIAGEVSIWSLLALVLLFGGAALVIVGTERSTRGLRKLWRFAAAAGALVITIVALMVVGPAFLATHPAPTEIGADPSSLGLDHESLTFETSDGVELAAWYVPTQNGAAVVLRHGAGSTRSAVLDEALVLAHHGFGVLLVDARGHGDSKGQAMDFGWYGEADTEAALAYLASRDDVDDDRIGLVGMSMGGEEVIGAAGIGMLARVVVAEGATGRVAADKAWLSDAYGWRGAVQEQLERAQYALTDVLTSAPSPGPLRASVAASGDTRFLLITAGTVSDEGHAAEFIAGGAPNRVEIWTVPDADHTAGLATDPEEWERRVIEFLEANLRGDQA